jgi:penicillin-binding protein 1A
MSNLFNGGPVDGGTFPAQIWGTYMKAARRGYCKDFQKPKAPFKAKPLKRTYRPAPVQRRPLAPGDIDPSTGLRIPPPVPTAPQVQPRIRRPAPRPPATGGNSYDPDAYNPDVYNNPPQPEVVEPTATPPP